LHVEACSEPFKEDVLKKILELKGSDYQLLCTYVEELKQDETSQLAIKNQIILEKKFKFRKREAQVDRNEHITEQWVDSIYTRSLKKRVFSFLRLRYDYKRQIRNCNDFVSGEISQKYKETRNEPEIFAFYEANLMKKALKAIRYEQECAHNRKFKRKVQSEIQNEVQAKVEEKKLQIDFLNSMIRELEEKYAIEKRKKTVLKNQCDQAYLRGVSAISTEAMKMSNSTLDDMYRGMKMPTYSNDNIYH